MISLDQVRLLEQKVEGMLALFSRLKSEKSALEKENGELKTELETLKAKCGRFEQDEAKLEQGILSVLNRLNDMEDAVQNVMDSSAVKPAKPEVSVHETTRDKTHPPFPNRKPAHSLIYSDGYPYYKHTGNIIQHSGKRKRQLFGRAAFTI